MNTLVEAYRQSAPDDQRSDDELTLLFGQQYEQEGRQSAFPDFPEDYQRVKEREAALAELNKPTTSEKVGKYVGQVVGTGVRALAELPASFIESAGIAGSEFIDKPLYRATGIELEGATKPLAEQTPFKIAKAIRDAAAAITPAPVPELAESFFATKLPSVAASIAGFIGVQGIERALLRGSLKSVLEATAKDALTESAARGIPKVAAEALKDDAVKAVRDHVLTKASEMIGTGVLGAGSSAASAYKEAIASGKSPEEALNQFMEMAGVGASMALPAGAVLGEAKTLLGKTVRGAATGGAVIGAQTAASNLIAGKDPLAGVREETAAGAIVTGALAALAHKLIGPRTKVPQQVESYVNGVPDDMRMHLEEMKYKSENGLLTPIETATLETLLKDPKRNNFYTIAEPVKPPGAEPELVYEGGEMPKTSAVGFEPPEVKPPVAPVREPSKTELDYGVATEEMPKTPATSFEAPANKLRAAATQQPEIPGEAKEITLADVPSDQRGAGTEITVQRADGTTYQAMLRKVYGGLTWIAKAKLQEGQIKMSDGLLGKTEKIIPPKETTEADRIRHLDYSPEDLAKYQELVSRQDNMAKAGHIMNEAGTEFTQAWKSTDNELIALKGKYNGNPPKQIVEAQTKGATNATTTGKEKPAKELSRTEARPAVPANAPEVRQAEGAGPDGGDRTGKGATAETVKPEEFIDVEGHGVALKTARGRGSKLARDAWEERRKTEPGLGPWEDQSQAVRELFIQDTPKLSDEIKAARPTSEAAWFEPKQKTYEGLKDVLHKEKAEQGSPPSRTHGVAAILDHATGKGQVHLVSTFENRGVKVTNFSPDVGKVRGSQKSLSLERVLEERLPDGEKRFEVIGSGYTKATTEYYHRVFSDRATFDTEFANPVIDKQRSLQEAAAAQEALMEATRTEAPSVETVKRVGKKERRKIPPAPDVPLTPDDIDLLKNQLPDFDTPEELGVMIVEAHESGSDLLSEKMQSLLDSIGEYDPEFIERVARDGLEDVISQYKYDIRTGRRIGESSKQASVAPKETGIQPVEIGGGSREGGTTPPLEVQQDRLGQPRPEDTGGNEEPPAPGGDLGPETKATVQENVPRVEDPVQNQLASDLQRAAAQAGLDINVLRKGTPEAAAFEKAVSELTGKPVTDKDYAATYEAKRRLTIVVSDAMGGSTVKRTWHELAHAEFADLPTEIQGRILDSIAKLSDDALGIDLSLDSRIRESDPANLGRAGLQEERLAEAVATRLQKSGFNPLESRGYADRFVRALKDYYLRAVAWLQRTITGHEDPEIALRYFENRLKRLLAGDTQKQSYADFAGLTKPSMRQQYARTYSQANHYGERMTADGRVSYEHVPDMDLASARFNLEAGTKFTLQEGEQERKFTRKTNVELHAAAYNHLERVFKDGAETLTADKDLAAKLAEHNLDVTKLLHEISGQKATPAELRAQLKDQKEAGGQPVQFDETKTGFEDKSNQERLLDMTLTNTQHLQTALDAGRQQWSEAVEKVKRKLERIEEQLAKAETEYKSTDFITRSAINYLHESAREVLNDIAGLSLRKGAIMEQLEALTPGEVLKDYSPVFQKLFTGDQLKGEKLFDILDQLAHDKKINFDDSVADIRKMMLADQTGEYSKFTGKDKESKALLATVVAFAKTNTRTMVELEMRDLKNAEERVAIEQQLKELKTEAKGFRGLARKVASNAKLEERARAAYSEARSEVRGMKRQQADAELKIAAANKFSEIVQIELADLGGKAALGQRFAFKDGAPYYAVKVGMTTAEGLKTKKSLRLNSTYKPTDPKLLHEQVLDMKEFLLDREAKSAAGDRTALDSFYQYVNRSYHELNGQAGASVNVKPAERFMTELFLMPSFRKVSEAFGNLLARNVDRRGNKYVAKAHELIHLGLNSAMNVAHRTFREEMAMLKLLPHGTTLDSLRENFIYPAKLIMEERIRDLLEFHHGDRNKAFKDAFQRIRTALLQANSSKAVAPQIKAFMPILEKLLTDHDTTGKAWVGKVAHLGVLDKSLKVMDAATGQMVEAARWHFEVGGMTFMKKLVKAVPKMVESMRQARWDSFSYAIPKAVEAYRTSGADAARAILDPFFNDPQHGDQVRERFFRAIAEMPVESAFKAPKAKDQVTHVPASPYHVMEALKHSTTRDIVGFADKLHELMGGQGDKAEYLGDVLGVLNRYYTQTERIVRKSQPKNPTNDIASIRGMIPDVLLNAREIENMPSQWFGFHDLDQSNAIGIAKSIAGELAFEPGAEGLASDLESIKRDIDAAKLTLSEARDEQKRLNPTFKERQVEKLVEQKLGERYRMLKQFEKKEPVWHSAVAQISEFYRKDNDPDGTVNFMIRFAQAISHRLVNNPASAIFQLTQIADFPLAFGVSPRTLAATATGVGTLGKEVARSLAGSFGLQIMRDSEYHQLAKELDLIDNSLQKNYSDAFERLHNEGRLTYAARAGGEILGTGINFRPEQAQHVLIRPAELFTSSVLLADHTLTKGMWRFTSQFVMDGIKYYKEHPEKLADRTFELTPETLKIKGETESFKRLHDALFRQGMNYDQMVRETLQRNDGTIFTKDQALGLYFLAMREVSLQKSPSTTSLGAYNSPIMKGALPLLNWSLSRALQIAGKRLSPEGQLEMRSVLHGLAAMGVISAGALGLSMMTDWFYYQELLGKKRNIRPVIGAPDAQQFFLASLEHLNRVGSWGFFTEPLNAVVNTGKGGDNRTFDVDKRVVFLSTLNSIMTAGNAFINQREADYAHVVRPLLAAMGGNGALQYMQIANHLMGLDNRESRMAARMNAQNYLRVGGRMLGMDVREFTGGYSAPTPLSPSLTRMELAAYANDAAGFDEARREAIKAATEAGYPDPVDHVKRAFAGRNPLRTVFRTSPSAADYARLLAALPEDGQADVSEALRQFNAYAERIGARGFEGRAEKPAASPFNARLSMPTFRQLQNRSSLRSAAVQAY